MNIVVIHSHTMRDRRAARTDRAVESCIRGWWRAVSGIHAATGADLLDRLTAAGGPGRLFVCSMARHIDSAQGQEFIPALLEAWGYRHLGSPAEALRRCRDGNQARERLEKAGITVAPFFAAGQEGERPREEDSGREFSVGLVGTRRRIHFPVRVSGSAAGHDHRRGRRWHGPGRRLAVVGDPAVAGGVSELADRVLEAVGGADYAHVRIRDDGDGPSVLAVDLEPDLGPRGVLFRSAHLLYGLDHRDLVRLIVQESIVRQGPWP